MVTIDSGQLEDAVAFRRVIVIGAVDGGAFRRRRFGGPTAWSAPVYLNLAKIWLASSSVSFEPMSYQMPGTRQV